MKSDNITIRPATLDDLTVLLQFEQELIKYERPFAPNLKEDPICYYDIEDFISNKDAQLLVAVIDNTLVGSGYALIKKSAPYKKPDKFAYLGFMYVTAEYRGKGINGIITEHLINWAKAQHLTEIQLGVYAQNTSAINAYTKVGFIPDLLKMRFSTKTKK